MLILSCRVGSTIRVGNDIRITVHARLGERVTFGVQAPRQQELRLDDTVLQPAPQPEGGCWYLFSLLGVRAFRIGSIEVRLCARAGGGAGGAADDQVHLAFLDADSVRIRLVEPVGAQGGGLRSFLDGDRGGWTRSLTRMVLSGLSLRLF